MPSSSTHRPSVAVLTGGGDRPYALGLADALRARDITFDFIASDDLESPELRADPRVRFLNLRGDQNPDAPVATKVWRVLVYYARLITYAASSRARVFHLLWNNKFEWFDRTLLLLYYRLLGKRLTLTIHNVNIRRRDGNDTWFNRFTLGVQYRLTGHLFVHTERMKAELMRDFPVPEHKVSIIPFGINSTVPDTDMTGDVARARLGLAPTDRVLLFFGNIAPYKGLEYLVDAFERLAPTDPQLRLVVAGRPKNCPDYWAQIERRLNAPTIASRVVMKIEYVPDADTEIYFKAADVLILPYTHIFQSGVLFLGYNFGLPVIAADVGALRDDIVEGRTGSVCRPTDASDLARHITDYFAGDLFRNLAARRGDVREFARERYSWAKVAEITAEAYVRLTGQGRV